MNAYISVPYMCVLIPSLHTYKIQVTAHIKMHTHTNVLIRERKIKSKTILV